MERGRVNGTEREENLEETNEGTVDGTQREENLEETNLEKNSRRSMTRKYLLPCRSGMKVKVCKTMFLSTITWSKNCLRQRIKALVTSFLPQKMGGKNMSRIIRLNTANW